MLALGASSSAAQTTSGVLFGTVRDAAGSVLPGLVVALTNVDTNARSEVVTDDRGEYRVVQLPPGQYLLDVAHPGFKRFVRRDLRIVVHEHVELDVTLEVGSVSETIEVVAAPPVLDTATSSVGRVVDNSSIQTLPLDTRSIYSLISLTPGVAGEIGQTHNRVNYSVNGARAGLMDTLIDGSSAAFPTVNGGHGISVFPSVEAVQEFKVHAGNYAAEFGRSLGSVLNLVSRSGANAFRGTVYDLYRNSRFDENTYFNIRRGIALPAFSRTQFGAMAGGPLRRDRLFFMTSYEGLRADSFREMLTTVPTTMERAGDFSASRGANGQPIVIYDPRTTVPNAAGNGFVRAPFPGNRIPRERMDPVALSMLRYWPAPNQPGDSVTGRNNFYASGVAEVNTDNLDLRMDYVHGVRGRLFGRYSSRHSLDSPPQFFPGDTAVAQSRVVQSDHGQNVVIDYASPVGDRTLVNVRLGFARNHFVFDNQSLGFSPTSLGLPSAIEASMDRPLFPAFSVADVRGLGGGDHRNSGFNNYNVAGSVSRDHASHLVKVGYEGRMLRINVWEARAATFTFSRLFTQGPNPLAATASGGHGFASFLLGAGSAGSILQNWKNVASQSFYHAWYVQDDWRVGERLTVNLGLRYDFDTPRTERYDRMSWFDPDVMSPLAAADPALSGLRGGLQFVGVDGHPRTQYDGDWDNVAPRVGAAYRLSRNTVIKGAVGRFFGPSSLAAQGTVGPYGFRVETPWVTSLDNLIPLNYLQNPFPDGFRPVPGASGGLLTAIGGRVEAPLRDTKTPNAWQWYTAIQRELFGGVLIEAAYVGNRGRDLSLGGENGYTLNQLDPTLLALGSALNELVPNPFFGKVATGPLSQPAVTRAQLLRPFPQFGDVIPLFSSGAHSSYDAIQLSVSRRFANGVAFDGHYVGSRSMDWGQNYQDAHSPSSANSHSAVHIPYRVVVSGIYELPIGRGRLLGRNMAPALDMMVGGWQVNGIWTFQAGPTLAIVATNTSGLFGQVTRPNWTGEDPRIHGDAEDKLDHWFDTTAFSQPQVYTLGNAPERIPGLRADRRNNLDLSIVKSIQAVGAARLQLRFEALNVLNDVEFDAPNLAVTSATFGQVTAQANAPRQLQFGVKLLW